MAAQTVRCADPVTGDLGLPAPPATIVAARARAEARQVKTDTGATVITMSAVTPERISWLWPGRLPIGKLVVFDGDPSTGKSTLLLDLAARMSAGRPWPDAAAGTGPAGVLLMSAEDGIADTVAPRLIAAGADLRNVHSLTEVSVTEQDGKPRSVPPSLPRDIPMLDRLIRRYRARLVVIDVLMAYLSGGVDSHRDQDVRVVLHQLAAMAEATGATVALIRHMNKTTGANALYRGGGSIGIIGAARAAYLVARDPDDLERRILAVTKLNIGVEPPALAYRLETTEPYGCARVVWEPDPVSITAADLLRAPLEEPERTERDEATDWLRDYLADQGGTVARRDVIRDGKSNGHTERTLQRAVRSDLFTVESVGFPRTTRWCIAVAPGTPNTLEVARLNVGGATVSDLGKQNGSNGAAGATTDDLGATGGLTVLTCEDTPLSGVQSPVAPAAPSVGVPGATGGRCAPTPGNAPGTMPRFMED